MRLREQLAMGRNHDFAPRLRYASKNTGAAARKAANEAMDWMSPMRRRRATRRRARMTGIGIAILAVPIGIWLGRMIFSDDASLDRSGWDY